jgi:hypothetical protein
LHDGRERSARRSRGVGTVLMGGCQLSDDS